jgi:oligopeptide transport system substrate-binding protein
VKKNLMLLTSMLLIIGMFLSMAYVALTKKDIPVNDSSSSLELEQKLRINIKQEPNTLHPGLAEDVTSASVLLQAFEGLTRIDLWGQTVNAAAKVIKISDDQRTYTFTLREATWSNGDAVIAEDFEYAWKWALNPANRSESAYQLYYIEGAKEYNKGESSVNKVGVKALDDQTLQVKLDKPTPNFLQITALPTYFPVNSKVAQKNPDWSKDSHEYPSNGPFELAEWSHNEKIVLKKNRKYWDGNAVRLETITMYMIDDPLTELTMFVNGKLDWAGSPLGQLPAVGTELIINEDRIQFHPITGLYVYKFNTKDEPFNNENIRKAFAFSINRQLLMDTIGQLGLEPARALVPPTLIPDNNKGYFKDNDVVNAKIYLQKGLKELGYNNAYELPPITLIYSSAAGHKEFAQGIQEMWKENLGVEVTVKELQPKKTSGKINIFDYDMPRLEWVGYYSEPINFLNLNRGSELVSNGIGWNNGEFQSILKQSQTEADPNKRLTLLKKAEAVMMKEMPVVPIYHYSNTWVQNEYLKGVALSGSSHIQFKWAYFGE